MIKSHRAHCTAARPLIAVFSLGGFPPAHGLRGAVIMGRHFENIHTSRLGVIHFRLAGVFATSRAQSMKRCAAGLSARVFTVTIPFGTQAIGR